MGVANIFPTLAATFAGGPGGRVSPLGRGGGAKPPENFNVSMAKSPQICKSAAPFASQNIMMCVACVSGPNLARPQNPTTCCCRAALGEFSELGNSNSCSGAGTLLAPLCKIIPSPTPKTCRERRRRILGSALDIQVQNILLFETFGGLQWIY